MDDKFIKELRKISRDDRRRSEFMIQGMKETLQERKEEGLVKRWMRRRKTKKNISQRFSSDTSSSHK
ncbi:MULTISPECIES: hypothetical protein [Paenibacillus]|uniref:Uncharacterized protein n=1 Tax=Paenibacillus cucumis (ex Kampfer et al. 2016) TaxID=1776858 RepID=A0ABS7KPI3_9BACL|nr:hypothetical protein [Paenibacillus cucumis (ex Kampfer et al. 2016)]MBY0205857.1 hypothetical protein [Paenibacillus cucumis (ex Kampfer et al. 2016)]MDP9699177.1 hypothetical protein [Paenibacillus intestini]